MKPGILGLLALAALGACETIIDVPEPAHTPALAVRYSLGTLPASDTATRTLLASRQLYVSASQRLFDTSPLPALSTATARLYDDGAGGALVEEFRPGAPYGGYYNPDQPGYYVPTRNFQPQPGGAYRLQVEAPGYEPVESRLTLPPAAPVIVGAAFTPGAGSDPYDRRGRLTVTIQDDAATADYYVAFARVLDATGRPLDAYGFGYVYEEDEDDDGVADLQGDRLHLSSPYGDGSFVPYADSDINGRPFTFSADVRIGAYDPITGGPLAGAQLEVVISRLTRDTYLFWLSRQRYSNVNGNPFAEPAPLYSNISGGYGVFGGFVDATVRVPL